MGRKIDEQSVASRQVSQEYRASKDANGFTEYEGFAEPGTTDSQARWSISKNTTDSDGFVSKTEWAGDGHEEHVWDTKEIYFT